MKTKSLLQSFLALCVLEFALFCNVKQANAYSFSATLSSGQTMYYNITDATNHEVALTFPNAQNSSWDGFNKPTGNVELLGTVYYNGVAYSLTSLGDASLEYCTSITALTIPSTVTSIANTALFGCTNLTTVTINSSDFMSSDFGPYNNLVCCFGNQVTSYILGSEVTTIGSGAFSGCTKMNSVTFLGTLTSIGTSAFADCNHLTRVYSNNWGHWCMIDFADIEANPLYFAHHLYAYPSGSEITNLVIPSGVTTIKAYTFYGTYGLTQMTIPSTVTSIENEAFLNCINLTQVTIPSTVTSIANYAFSGCSSLTRLNITDLAAWCAIDFTSANANPLSIAHHLYLSGSEITNLTIPSSVTSIKKYVFYGATGLTSVTIPNSVTSIGNSAFYGCTGLTRVNISNLGAWCGINFGNAEANPLTYAHHLYLNNTQVTNLSNLNNATSIRSYAFNCCTDFTSLTIASSVTSIGSYAFDRCSNITSVTNSATSIGSYAFKDCTRMTELTFLGSLSSIGNGAFSGCSGLTRVNVSNLNAWCRINFENASSNPLTIAHHLYHNSSLVTSLNNLSTVTSIGSYAFSGCTDFTLMTIPTSVQSIGNYAFVGCTGITSVIIPSSVQSIGNNAFSGCTSLISVTINSNAVASSTYSLDTNWSGEITSSNNFRSRFGNQVTNYVLGQEVTAIGQKAFSNCTGITALTFLGPMSSIDSSAFESCSGLTRVNVSNLDAWCGINYSSKIDNPLYYAHHLYHNNILVTNLDILSTPTSIGTYAFSGCTDLISANIPNSVQSIGYRAFSDCSGITSVTIPVATQSIEDQAFCDSPNLTSVTINSNAVASTTYSCSFSYSTNYTYDNFRSRFGNQVTSYTIGPEVTAIGEYAFCKCTGITELYVSAMTPPTITNTTFLYVSTTIPVYVPHGSVAVYQAAQYWSRFTNFIGSTSLGHSIVPIPYVQSFATNSAPNGWNTYVGHYQEVGDSYTATLTPNTNNSWRFGTQNGVFNSHAYATVGDASSNECRWLVSPPIMIDDADNVYLSFDLAMSRESGNHLPITPGAQTHQIILVLVSNNGGITWNLLAGWSGAMTGLEDLNTLTPDGDTYQYSMSAYQNQTVQVAFYAGCTDGNDYNNHVHLDNFGIRSYDMSVPPASVTVSEITGHTAKVHWTPALPMQSHWDVCICEAWNYTPPTNLIVHCDDYLWYNAEGLTEGTEYKAWVRYNDGATVSNWICSDVFETEMNCNPPINVQVETTLHKIFVSWEPGQSNQTSWSVTVVGSDAWEYPDIETTSYEIDATSMLLPGEEFQVYVKGYCTDGDGWASSEYINAQMQDYPTLTVNDNTQYNDFVVVVSDQCLNNNSWSQFVIPASQLTDLQYSTITKLEFYIASIAQSWSDARFDVKMAEVDFNHLGNYCDESFYDWDDMSLFYRGTLEVINNKVTIEAWGNHSFKYHDGNLLIGVKQIQTGNSEVHVSWYGTETGLVNSSMYKYWLDSEQSVCNEPGFLPKVTFSYETDDSLPPTDFEAYVTGLYEVSFSWTIREGQTATEIMVCNSPNFNGSSTTINTTESYYTAILPDFFEPEETYYYRYRGLYEVDGETHYSGWSLTDSFTMPEECVAPENPQITQLAPFSALLSWDGGGEYEYVEYREGTGEYQTAFSCDFTATTSLNGWTIRSNESNTWERIQLSNQRFMRSNIEGTMGVHDHWLITPQIEFPGRLSFKARRGSSNAPLYVYVSVTDTEQGSFTRVQTIQLTTSYQTFTIDLTEYAGAGYVAFVHNFTVLDPNTGTPPTYQAMVDDVAYQGLVYGEWISAGVIEDDDCINLYDLTPGTTYQARVRTHCDTGYDSEWTEHVTFSTPGNIVFEDSFVKLACVNAWDGILDDIHDGELSYAEAAAVTELANVFNVDPTITSFNELQYFTGLTEIDDHAFSGCYNLSAITLPSTVAMIGDYAFENCSSLQNIVIPPGVTTIGHYAFRYSGLTEADLPYSVATIGALAFGDCDNLVSVYIHASVTNINGNAFTGAALANIEVDVNNPVYDSRNGCNAIIHTATNTLITGCKNTVIPDGITTIDVFAFENCSGLTDIILPATVETIKGWAFNFCTGLATIEVYATTPPTLEEYALMNLDVDNIHVYVPCGSLEVYQNSAWSVFNLVENCNIVFEDPLTKQLCVEAWDLNYDGELSYREAAAVTHLGDVFQFSSITRFNELQYFTGLYEIHQDDFTDCVNLTTVTFPPTVIWIKSEAFMNCFSLASITFGENIGTIYNYAFENCTGISFVKVEATTPPTIGEYAFYGVETANILIYVPCGTKSDYQNDSDWNVVFNPDNFIDPCAEVMQTVELSAGWNWFSMYIEVDDPVTILQMVEASLGENGVMIKSSQVNTEYDSEWGWFGDLDDVGMTNEQMYKIQVSAPCTLSLEGVPANTAEHPITINPGWNWIGFPSTVPMSLEDAFVGFAQEGDKIRNSATEIDYDPEWGWFGDFETLVPGQGYMYYSASSVPRTLVFPTSKK